MLNKKLVIHSPAAGQLIPLEQVKDDTFASGALGQGCALIPESGEFGSPVKGKVAMLFETKHAIGLVAEDGTEVLIHIGLDTVKLNGEHFTALVKTGDAVEVGTPLVQVDLKAVRDAGYDLVTPVLITNSAEVLDVVENSREHVEAGDEILTVIR